MSAGQWYVSRGRIGRRTFWLRYLLPLLAASIVAALLDAALGLSDANGNGPIGLVVSLALLVPSISSTVTRLHDRGHSAWWLLWALVPLVGWLVLFVQNGFLAGHPVSNRYGSPPGQPTPQPW